MKIKSRSELEANFKNGKRPSQVHFAELISSMLNRRDDQFLGRWKTGTTYRTGDIVVYDRALWEMTGDGSGGDQEICSREPPDLDNKDWRSLIVPAEDNDWFLVDLDSDAPSPAEAEERDHDQVSATMHANPRVVRVGIGTDDPHTRLEVTNGKSGRFLFNLDRKVNPALGIVNLRPGSRENYLASGVDNDVAVFVTDSDYGFLFRAGGESGTDDHEIDINQGKELISILPHGKGKLGIGRQPDDYQLDVDGLARSYGFYVDTDESNLTAVKPLRHGLDKLCELRPVTFEWDASTELDDPGTKIGLVAHEVDDIFPEAVKTNRDRTKAVAYHALVPVLINAVQEQKSTIGRMQTRLDELEKRIAALQTPSDTDQ